MENLRPLEYGKPNDRNKIKVMGYEPYFKEFVQVATIYLPHKKNEHLMINGRFKILHCHGYFPNHEYGLRVLKYCNKKY